MTHWNRLEDTLRSADEALKAELLREAMEWDDLNDQIVSISDDTEE